MLLSPCHWRKTIALSWALAALLLTIQVASVSSVATSLPDGDQRCKGTDLDYSRLQTVSTDNAAGMHARASSDDGATSSFVVNQAFPVRLATAGVNGEASPCVVQRLRINEAINGIPVYGADSVVTLDECYGAELVADAATTDIKAHVEDIGFTGLTVREVTGKSFSSVQVKRGYTPLFSAEDTVNYLSTEFQVDKDSGNIEPPKLYIYVTEPEDYLAYFSDLLVKTDDGETNVIRVIVHSYDLTILSICLLSSSKTVNERRHLRQDQRELQSESCYTCAINETLTLSGTTTTQEIRSLYLNNTGKNAIVTEATAQSDGRTVNVPGSVPSVFYNGTYNCFSRLSGCVLSELPTGCADALSDVHYISVVTLQYLQSALNVMGGLAVSSSSPQSVRALTHVDAPVCTSNYYQNQLFCVVARGVTQYSSGLGIGGQSGALLVGYSDIYGTVIEFLVNDSLDTPDFLVGERLKGSHPVVFRYMENPPDDGRSIGSVCEYDISVGVRQQMWFRFSIDFYSVLTNAVIIPPLKDYRSNAGVPNKAYVKSVRECQAHSCSTSESECAILLGNLFMYTNIYRLSSTSTFLDAAAQTCSAVSEFFTNTGPTTSCTTTEVMSFIVAGWASVSVDIDSSTCTAVDNCPAEPSAAPTPRPDPQFGCQSATSVSIPSTLTGDTSTAMTFSSQSCGSARNHNSPGVWYSVTGTGNSIVASLCNTAGGDTQLSVWTGSCSNLQCVVGNDDHCSVRSQVTFPTTLGQTYYIYVWGALSWVIAIDMDNFYIYVFDSDTGTEVMWLPDVAGFQYIPAAMASRPGESGESGRLFIWGNQDPSGTVMFGLLRVGVSLDPLAVGVVPTSLVDLHAGAIAFRHGVLYGLFGTSLYSLNEVTGIETVVCLNIVPIFYHGQEITGMATNPTTGLLHLITWTTPTMYTIDPSTCTLETVGQLSPPPNGTYWVVVNSIVWNPNTNKFLGAGHDIIFDLDVDGTVTHVRHFDSRMAKHGMAMYSDVFPTAPTPFPTSFPTPLATPATPAPIVSTPLPSPNPNPFPTNSPDPVPTNAPTGSVGTPAPTGAPSNSPTSIPATATPMPFQTSIPSPVPTPLATPAPIAPTCNGLVEAVGQFFRFFGG
ncbi:CHU large protein [Seminavis robusta]|uniref:CHU large protein n=1 Tax=Seminavis robusta TaxID=568900 RepID=A0A9N8F3B4_9STRA|nr:CHU large protein [Seminavis robusta]|eukprot:Sro2678_g334450.1 CHU large protein (1117) ;mRNA; r:4073-8508